MKLIHLAEVLRNAGLKVEEQPGWLKRGGEMDAIRGIIAHHTAGPKSGIIPSLRTLIEGRPGLRGPLAQLALGRTGVWYVIAAGKANHAGKGRWKGITHGNGHYIGVEAENTGLINDSPWPPVQIESYIKGVAAILQHFKLPASAVIGHKEWAPSRKMDPSFDMNTFREKVKNVMARKRKVSQEEKEVIEDFYVPSTPPDDDKAVAHEHGDEEAKEIILELREEEKFHVGHKAPKLGDHVPEEVEQTEAEEEARTKAWPWRGKEPAVEPPTKKKSLSARERLEDLGWSKEQAAALMAQAKVESNLDPNAAIYTVNKVPTTKENPLAELTYFGLMKWNKPRIANLDKFLQLWNHDNAQERKRNDEEMQVRFIDWELRNTEKDAFSRLSESTDLMSALRAATGYVRPPGWSIETPESATRWADRVAAAYEQLNK